MKSSLIVLGLLLASTPCSYAQHKSLAKRLDQLIEPQFKPIEPGLVVLVAKKGTVVYEKAFGLANMELKVPLKPDMVFRIGSVSKQFTAIGILKLMEEGKLSLQDSLQQYIKNFPSKGETITIENLLTHTSGIKEYTAIESNIPFIERHDIKPDYIIDHFKNEPLEFVPGSSYGYSNSNYVLLAAIIAAVSGKSFSDYMTTNILMPLGLTKTSYAEEKTIIEDRVCGYTKDNGFYENAAYQTLSLGYGCGDLLSTVGDLNKWNTALHQGEVVSKATLQKALTQFKLNDGSLSEYGYGWFISKIDGSICYKHEGQTSGFIAYSYYFPKEDTYVAMLTNLKSGEDKTDFSDKRFMLFSEIIRTTLDRPKETIHVDKDILSSYVGIYENESHTKRIEVKIKDGALVLHDGLDFKSIVLSVTKFNLPDIPVPTTIEFIVDGVGKIVKLIVQQKERAEWRKMNN